MECPALVLCHDNIVRAYETVGEARAAHPGLNPQQFAVSETGTKTRSQYTLHEEPAAAALSPLPTVSASLSGSLLRTNVQKAVRRQDAAAAAASVLQYFAQSPQKEKNEYQKKLLARLPVIAAEDATTVPLLPLAVFHTLGATSFKAEFALRAAPALSECAAQLAAAPREPACTSSEVWRDEPPQALEGVFGHGWAAEDAAQVLTLGLAARMEAQRRNKPEARWLYSLERAVRARLASGQAACVGPASASASAAAAAAAPASASASTASGGLPLPALQPDGTLLAEVHRLYFAADFHNPKRLDELYESGLKAFVGSKVALKQAMQRQALEPMGPCLPCIYPCICIFPCICIYQHLPRCPSASGRRCSTCGTRRSCTA